MMNVLIDTNVLLVSLSSRSPLYEIFNALIKGDFNLIISTEIIFEYEEQIRLRYNDTIISEFLLILHESPNVLHFESYFKWNLISKDADDNKFVDCAVASAADLIVTSDKHFDILKSIPFPLVNVINPFEFLEILRNQNKK